jgi:hypothetical protein
LLVHLGVESLETGSKRTKRNMAEFSYGVIALLERDAAAGPPGATANVFMFSGRYIGDRRLASLASMIGQSILQRKRTAITTQISAPTTAEVSRNQGHEPVIEHRIKATIDTRKNARAIQRHGMCFLSNICVISFELEFLAVSGLIIKVFRRLDQHFNDHRV